MSDLNLQDNNETLRLQLYLAKCGVASRRASEKIITDGRVCVNGEKVTQLGTKVTSKDEVTVDGKLSLLKKIYAMFYFLSLLDMYVPLPMKRVGKLLLIY